LAPKCQNTLWAKSEGRFCRNLPSKTHPGNNNVWILCLPPHPSFSHWTSTPNQVFTIGIDRGPNDRPPRLLASRPLLPHGLGHPSMGNTIAWGGFHMDWGTCTGVNHCMGRSSHVLGHTSHEEVFALTGVPQSM
jgi:hypothetical protein